MKRSSNKCFCTWISAQEKIIKKIIAHVFPILHVARRRAIIKPPAKFVEKAMFGESIKKSKTRSRKKLSNEAISLKHTKPKSVALSTTEENKIFVFQLLIASLLRSAVFSRCRFILYFMLCRIFFILFSHFLFYNSPIVQSVAGFGCDKT